ncbi:KR domain-containing protein, partial [Jidongwangia harbinensis]|uniref:KR domain-containing protein n=1 Tax=Jidongwangia harbinensis TaxID=2878561 RepID=UPI001CD9377F
MEQGWEVVRPGDVFAALEVVQAWLGVDDDERVLVVLTADPSDPVVAGVWGLVRSAQAEQPGRFVLLGGGGEADVPAVLATGEPQVVVAGDGSLRVPRLVRAAGGEREPDFGSGAVLLTGASGALGGVVAQHLVAAYGVSELVLLSRRGRVAELDERLVAAGARVRWVAGDAGDRELLETLVDGVSAVVHLAGVLDDGVVTSLTPQRLARV